MTTPTPGRAELPTPEVVQRLLECIAVSDWHGVGELFADDFRWELSWPTSELDGPIPWIRPRRTTADIRAHFATLAAHNSPDGAGTFVERILIDGSDAVVLGTIRNRLHRPHTGDADSVSASPTTGVPYRSDFALHLRVEAGHICQYHIFEDSLAISEAWKAMSEIADA